MIHGNPAFPGAGGVQIEGVDAGMIYKGPAFPEESHDSAHRVQAGKIHGSPAFPGLRRPRRVRTGRHPPAIDCGPVRARAARRTCHAPGRRGCDQFGRGTDCR
jgi:hypothetical protein